MQAARAGAGGDAVQDPPTPRPPVLMFYYGWVVAVLCGLGMGLSGPGHSFYFVNFAESFISDAGAAACHHPH